MIIDYLTDRLIIFTKNQYYFALISFIFCAFISFKLVPLILEIGKKYNLFDLPNFRKSHKIKIVRIGGITIFIPYFCVLIFFASNNFFFKNEINSFYIYNLLICSSVIFIVGLVDDIKHLSPWVRLFIQVITSIYIWNCGLGIHGLDILLMDNINNLISIPKTLIIIVNILWIAGLINAFNWIDGLDGLASGVGVIILLGICCISFLNNNIQTALISLSLCGAFIGFFFHNKNPASIHMGDCGSYLLGFNLAILSISCLSSGEELFNLNLNIPISFVILFVPIADMTKVIFSRIIEGKLPFYPDRRHLHHKLLDIGINSFDAVKFIYCLNFISISLALSLIKFQYGFILFSLSLITFLLFSRNCYKKLKNN